MYSTRFFPVLFGSSVVLISGIFTVITRRLYFSYANFYDYSRWWYSFIRFLLTLALTPKYAKFFLNCSEEHENKIAFCTLDGVFINMYFFVILLHCFSLSCRRYNEFRALLRSDNLRLTKLNLGEFTKMTFQVINVYQNLEPPNTLDTKIPNIIFDWQVVIDPRKPRYLCWHFQETKFLFPSSNYSHSSTIFIFPPHLVELIGSGSSISAPKWPIQMNHKNQINSIESK